MSDMLILIKLSTDKKNPNLENTEWFVVKFLSVSSSSRLLCHLMSPFETVGEVL